MEFLLIWALKLFLPALAIGGLYLWADRTNTSPRALNDAKQRQFIAVNTAIYGLLVVILGSIALFVDGLVYRYRHFYSDGNVVAGATIAVFFGLCAIVLSQYLGRSYRVHWDDHAIEGPSAYRLPPFGAKRLRLTYQQIDGIGVDWAEQLCLYRSDGRAVKFSHFYRGHDALMKQLERKRPDLLVEEDDWVEP
ncbi:hypothetical protein [uncultured Sulfitobacter sp.]|uniref:hypothetical protein n=1 Tax=uncultured Sulfitobacter sp. TaxID=191468 RepID=UPI00261191E1|nr:hypothetical protein [uncultured Sulfitobacter sp.]